MDKKVNTPRTVCRAIVAVTIAAVAVAAIIGCSSLKGAGTKANIATVIQTAYDLGGREAVSNKIESLVAEGKLTPSQAVRLHALAQLAYEGIVEDLTAGGAATNATPASISQGGCSDCSVPGASGGNGGGCNEDANGGNCADGAIGK